MVLGLKLIGKLATSTKKKTKTKKQKNKNKVLDKTKVLHGPRTQTHGETIYGEV